MPDLLSPSCQVILLTLLEQKVRPNTYLSSYEYTSYQYKGGNFKDGKYSLRVMDGEKYSLSTYIYYNKKSYYPAKYVEITKDTKEINMELVDTDLSIDIIKGYLKKLGFTKI